MRTAHQDHRADVLCIDMDHKSAQQSSEGGEGCEVWRLEGHWEMVCRTSAPERLLDSIMVVRKTFS